ncbi:PadR family transcriptional regulator [Arthrobacter dokdonensis]|uniref:PadR family transcriptional regulator n=1 Tax=Arthrobacter dokdonellae TaxID=2211210 RepID=UPI001D131CCE|nr:PadR family transcriptional regulator [Arthrobacter dokdonellae]
MNSINNPQEDDQASFGHNDSIPQDFSSEASGGDGFAGRDASPESHGDFPGEEDRHHGHHHGSGPHFGPEFGPGRGFRTGFGPGFGPGRGFAPHCGPDDQGPDDEGPDDGGEGRRGDRPGRRGFDRGDEDPRHGRPGRRGDGRRGDGRRGGGFVPGFSPRAGGAIPLDDDEGFGHRRGFGPGPARGFGPGFGPGFGGGFGPGFRGGFGRGGRVRKGNVRSAILSLLSQDSYNGYGMIGAIATQTDGAWRPSPGSIYPALAALQAEGLIESAGKGKRTEFELTEAGRAYVAEHAEETAAVWADVSEEAGAGAELRQSIGKLMGAVHQIGQGGTEEQVKATTEALDTARRAIYKMLAD